MWLYIPGDTSRSAPVEAVSTLPSNWRFPALAQSCVSRGKHSPSRTWSTRWKKAGWLQRLCGAMPEPSTADASVDMWMRSLEAFPASRIPLPGESREATTSATCGPMLDASLSSPEPELCSSKTSAACSRQGLTKSLEPKGSGETYASWASTLKADYSARRKSVRRTGGNGSSSSAWPSPRAAEAGPDFAKEQRSSTGMALAAVAIQASAWPTPTTRDWKDTGDLSNVPENALLGRVASNWSTPRSSDGEKGGPNMAFGAGGTPLPAQACQWPTPTSLSFGESHQPGNSKSMNETLRLAENMRPYIEGNIWPTPTALNRPRSDETLAKVHEYRERNAGQKTVPLYLEDLTSRLSLPAPETSTHGARSQNTPLNYYLRIRATTDLELRSEMRALLRLAIGRKPKRGWTRTARTAYVRPSFRKSLNPRFVALLMGWPPIASTGFGFWGTASYRFRELMRSELSRLVSSPVAIEPAKPKQLTLFG